MPIFVNCVCGKRLQGRDEDAGRPTKCPFCGQILTLPEAAAPALELEPWRSPSMPAPAPAPVPEPLPASGYVCRVCRQSFAVHQVYSEGSTVICKRCFDAGPARAPEPPPEPTPSRGDRWEHLKLPLKPKRLRRRDDREYEDDEDIVRPRSRQIYNYLTEAILCTLFCCLPFGIVGIVKAAEVDSYLRVGDYRSARSSSDAAKTWCAISFALGIPAWIVAFAMFANMSRL